MNNMHQAYKLDQEFNELWSNVEYYRYRLLRQIENDPYNFSAYLYAERYHVAFVTWLYWLDNFKIETPKEYFFQVG